MAGPQREPDDALKALLTTGGARFSFFRAVYLAHRLSPDAVAVGELGPAAREPVRFRHDPRLIFHSGDVSQIALVPRASSGPWSAAGTGARNSERRDDAADATRLEITSAFLGLTGSSSPLATAMLEDVLQAESSDQTALAAFYDLFHHRLLSLFYRAWKKYRLAAGFRLGADDMNSRRVLSFVGIDAAGPIPDAGISPLAQLSLAPLLSIRARSSRTLEIVLRHALRPITPSSRVWVEQFVLRRVLIHEEQRVKLGVVRTTLGVDLTIGASVIDQSGRFRVHVAPVTYDIYESLMPGGRHYPMLRNVVEHFSRGHLEAELELEVIDHSAGFRLGSERSSRLGVTTQLSSAGARNLRMRVLMSEDIREARPRAVRDSSGPPSVSF
jgi:type VI secretion system protein ImpH